MKVTTEALERCETLLTIEFDPAKEQDLLKKAANRISREVNIPGFRRGKAPLGTVIRRFGLEVVQQEAMENMGDKFIKDALDQVDIKPFAQIQLDEVTWDPLVIKLRIPTEPKVEVGDYRNIRLEAEPVEVTDEDVDKELKSYQEQNATWSPVERSAELGDLISMTVTEKDGETVLVENESVEFELTDPPAEDDTSRIDLTTPLLGLSAGESKTFTITYPQEFSNADYAGKEITFSVEVSGVKVKELDPLDDDFAQQISEFDTLAELKENIRTNLIQQRERQADNKLGSEMVDKIIEASPLIEWPLVLEEEEIDGEVERLERRLKDAGLTLESYLLVQKKTKDEWREGLRENVVTRLKRGLVVSRVAELEGLEVNQAEILEQAKLIADMSGGGDRLWRNIIASESQQSLIASDVMSSKTIERLAAIAKGEAPEPGSEAKTDSVESVETAESEAESTTETAPAEDADEAELVASVTEDTTEESTVKDA